MKKQVWVALGLGLELGLTAARGAASPFWESFNLRPYGSFEYRGERASNEQDFSSAIADDRQQTLTRTRLGFDATLAKGITGRMEFVRGPANGGLPNDNSQFGKPSKTIDNELANFYIQNAYFDLSDFGGIDRIRLGRQYLGRPGDLLVYYAPINDNAMTVRSLQGITVQENIGKVQTQLVFAKGVEQDTIPQPGVGGDGSTELDEGINAGDVNLFYGLLNSDQLLNGSVVKAEFELGLYRGIDKNSNRSDDANVVDIIDTRAKFSIPLARGADTFSFAAEAALNAGRNRETLYDEFGVPISSTTGTSRRYLGNAAILKVAYNWRSRLEGHGLLARASGDENPGDEKIRGFRDFSTLGLSNGGAGGGLPGSDFRYGKIYHDNVNLGIGPGLDTSTIGDFGLLLVSFGIHYTLPLLDNRLSLKGDYFEASADRVPNDSQGKRIMSEVDLEFRYAHSVNASVEFGYAWLRPYERLNAIRSAALGRAISGADAIRMSYINFNIKFGMPPEPLSH